MVKGESMVVVAGGRSRGGSEVIVEYGTLLRERSRLLEASLLSSSRMPLHRLRRQHLSQLLEAQLRPPRVLLSTVLQKSASTGGWAHAVDASKSSKSSARDQSKRMGGAQRRGGAESTIRRRELVQQLAGE